MDRPSGSASHPNSGQPKHEMTGGNVWIPRLLASAVVGSPVHSPTNAALLGQGPLVLTLDLSQGEPLNDGALLEAASVAVTNLEQAASITHIAYDPLTGLCTFRVVNHTGHKLISGFPEGRRMFVNVRVLTRDRSLLEINPYDTAAGTLRGLAPAYSPHSPPLGPLERHMDELVYEVHPSSSLTGEESTFHFVLATGRGKDNRIPPRGFRVAEARQRLCEPGGPGPRRQPRPSAHQRPLAGALSSDRPCAVGECTAFRSAPPAPPTRSRRMYRFCDTIVS